MEITPEILKSFIEWTKLKIRIHALERVLYFYEGQIWWTSLGQNIGSETNGKNDNFERPVLILKKINATTAWILPISSKEKEGPFIYPFINSRGEANVMTLSQIRLISSNRFIRKIGKISKRHLVSIKQKIRDIL